MDPWLMRVVVVSCYLVSNVLVYSAMGAKTRHFMWEVEYMHWSPDGLEGIVMAINGQFPGPTIRARAGDTLHVELTNKLHTEGVVIHWHGIRQVSFLLLSSCYFLFLVFCLLVLRSTLDALGSRIIMLSC